MNPRMIVVLISILIFFFVIELIRRQKMTLKYSIFWLALCITVFTFAIHHQWLDKISISFGFELPSNCIFFLLFVFFIFLSLLLTIYVNEQNSRSEKLAQVVGMLGYQIKQMELRSSSTRSTKIPGIESSDRIT